LLGVALETLADDVCARRVYWDDGTRVGDRVRLEIDGHDLLASAKQKAGTTGRIGGGGFERSLVPVPERTEPPSDGGLTLLQRNISENKKRVSTGLGRVVHTRP
jgi:hypothetical protein